MNLSEKLQDLERRLRELEDMGNGARLYIALFEDMGSRLAKLEKALGPEMLGNPPEEEPVFPTDPSDKPTSYYVIQSSNMGKNKYLVVNGVKRDWVDRFDMAGQFSYESVSYHLAGLKPPKRGYSKPQVVGVVA